MFAENQDLRDLKKPNEIVKCISQETYGKAPLNLVSFFNSLPQNNFTDFLKISSVPRLFHLATQLFEQKNNPVPLFAKGLTQYLSELKSIVNSDISKHFLFSSEDNKITEMKNELAEHTGTHYGNLFRNFSVESYFGETRRLLEERLTRNNIDLSNISNWSILDQGCGGGRYTVAWSLLGAKSCTGVDISEIGIEDANARVKFSNIQNVHFQLANVLNIPLPDDSYDVVFSNGVLHHTNNWEKGIEEQLRLLKPGGLGWLYLIEDPGGIFWDKIEILRAITKNVNKNYAIKVMELLNIPSNRIFYMLDHVMVPVNTRMSGEELESVLLKHGAKNIKRLTRGTGFDRVEQIFHRVPFAFEKFGIGENRYIFSK